MLNIEYDPILKWTVASLKIGHPDERELSDYCICRLVHENPKRRWQGEDCNGQNIRQQREPQNIPDEQENDFISYI